MELFFMLAGVVLAGVFVSLLLKQSGLPVLSYLLALTVSALVLLRLLPLLAEIFVVFRRLAEGAGLSGQYLSIILKILAISYAAEFIASLCRDAGESAYAAKVELAGKISVMLLAVPVIVNILDAVLQILP
ncbi:MAG TPA: stage III sporulation protein AD [Candidatus Avidehalobacter gallistercoris]|uniref:Stage III sporulation protein AD n=1 Tax=Candidatus Avidehalobacter gallistercoris TaxID=2840694 RepID=A0A9D1HK46_9FIRM|nr:stage III sporulation protein AD [Candidatus Avidehalobacter gallistercoris]